MISFFGYGLYAVVILGCFTVGTIKEMLTQAYLLAPELSIGMLILYIYPLILSMSLLVLRKTEKGHGLLLKNQTNIAASVAVSLGLIGTFQGLTAMVNSIATSMGGEGDISEKMGGMIDAISSALSAMSYAFLTSILGVAVSVLLVLSLNFWMFKFKNDDEKNNENTLNALIDKSIENANKLNSLVDSEVKQEKLIMALEQFSTLQSQLAANSELQTKYLCDLFNKLESTNIEMISKSCDNNQKIGALIRDELLVLTSEMNVLSSLSREKLELSQISYDLHKDSNEKLVLSMNKIDEMSRNVSKGMESINELKEKTSKYKQVIKRMLKEI